MSADEPSVDRPGRPRDPTALSVRQRVLAAPVTVGIIVLCFGAFISTLGACALRVDDPRSMLTGSWLMLEGCGNTLADLGALRMAELWMDGSWWRVLAAGLLHGSWLHLILNSWSLWAVGEWVESTWGHLRTLVLFGLSSVCGCLASAAWVEASMVVGASAGVMGMAGAIFVARVIGRGVVAERLRPISARVLGGLLVVMIVLGASFEFIAQAGHLGGLAAGALLGLAWSGRAAMVGHAGRLGLVVTFAGLVLLARQPEDREGYYEFLGNAYLERDENLRAAASFEVAFAQRPDELHLANGAAYGLAKAGVELDRARELVDQALAEEPDNADYLDTLGWILCRQGDAKAGMKQLEKASKLTDGGVAEIERHLEECADAEVK